MSQLAALLDSEDPCWRRNSYFVLDNALWHKSTAVLSHFDRLEIRVVFSGPYSYDASPVELFFACFKRGNLLDLDSNEKKDQSAEKNQRKAFDFD